MCVCVCVSVCVCVCLSVQNAETKKSLKRCKEGEIKRERERELFNMEGESWNNY